MSDSFVGALPLVVVEVILVIIEMSTGAVGVVAIMEAVKLREQIVPEEALVDDFCSFSFSVNELQNYQQRLLQSWSLHFLHP